MGQSTLSLEEARKRRNRKLRQVRRHQNIVIAIAAIAAVAVLVAAVYLYNSSMWDIKKVKVTGNSRVTTGKISRLLAVPKDQSLLKFDSASYAAKLRKEPWIRSAVFTRSLPSSLNVTIAERQPVFYFKQGRGVFLVDETGFVIAADDRLDGVMEIESLRTPRLRTGTILRSSSFRNAVQTVAQLDKETKSKVVRVSAPSVARLSLWTSDQVEIVLGRARNTKYKLAVARKILESSDVKIIYIDLTTPKTPVVKKVEAAPR